MKNRCCALFLFIVAVAAEVHAAVNPPPQVVPAVQEWKGREGTLPVHSLSTGTEMRIAYLPRVADMLEADFAGIGGQLGKLSKSSSDSTLVLFATDRSDLIGKKLGSDGYKIDIDDFVTITAHSPEGAFYATRTLLQMLAQNPKKAELPKGTIVDYPQYAHRMLMLDVGRKPISHRGAQGLSADHGLVQDERVAPAPQR